MPLVGAPRNWTESATTWTLERRSPSLAGPLVEAELADHGHLPPGPVLAVRRIDGLVVEREVPLRDFGRSGGVPGLVEAVACRDRAAGDVALFVREDRLRSPRGRVVQLRGTVRTTVWEGAATHAAFHPDGHLAFVTGGPDGTDLRLLDLTTQPPVERPVATLPEKTGAPVVGPGGWVVALTSADGLPSPRLVVTVELGTGKVQTVTVPGESSSGTVVWAADRRLVFIPDFSDHPVRLYDRNLRQIVAWRGWEATAPGPMGWAAHNLVVDGQLIGLTRGAVRTAAVEEGTTTLLTELGDGLAGAIAVVPDPGAPPLFGAAGGADSATPGSGWTIAALAVVLAAGTVVAVGTIGKSR